MEDPTILIGRLRVLIVSSQPETRRAVRAALAQEASLDFQIAEGDDFGFARAYVQQHELDLIVMDTTIPDVRWLAQNAQRAAIVFLADDPSAPAREDVVAAGATDFFDRSEYDESPAMLWQALQQTVRYHAVNEQRRHLSDILRQRDARVVELTQSLWQVSPYDPRTGWLCHRQILDRLQEESRRASRYKIPLALALANVTGSEGPSEDEPVPLSDPLVVELANRTRTVARQTDVIGHYGRDSFLFLLTNTDLKGGVSFCQRVSEKLQDPFLIGQEARSCVYCFGIAEHQHGQSAPDLLGLAQERLERALASEQNGAITAE